MAENTWTIAAPVKRFKMSRPNVKGEPAVWGSLRICLNLNPLTFTVDNKTETLPSNDIEIDVKLTFDQKNSPKDTKSTEYLLSNLKTDGFIIVHSAKVDKVKRHEKVNDEWQEKILTGITAYAKNIKAFPLVGTHYNNGLVIGKVAQESGSKIIVEESYRNVKDNEWKTRSIPILIPDRARQETSYANKMVLCAGQIAGRTSDGNSKVYVVADFISHI